MTVNSRHVRPQLGGVLLYGRRTQPAVGALARIPRTNVTLPAALGRGLSHIFRMSRSPLGRPMAWVLPGWGELVRIMRLTRTLRREKAGP